MRKHSFWINSFQTFEKGLLLKYILKGSKILLLFLRRNMSGHWQVRWTQVNSSKLKFLTSTRYLTTGKKLGPLYIKRRFVTLQNRVVFVEQYTVFKNGS